jgi:phosphoserine phosphatase
VIQIFARYSFGFLPLKELHAEIFSHVLKGLRLADLECFADLFLSTCEERVCPILYLALQNAQKAGHQTFLLSSSPDFLVSRIAKRFSFDRFAGTRYLVDKEGRLCEILLLITGPEKKEIANQWIEDASSTVAYSDSFDDVSLLEWVGLPVAVRPDRKLKEHALRFNWGIL